jgi:hypothetical protein
VARQDGQGETKIETERCTVAVTNNGGKQPIDLTVCPEQLPAEFQKVSVTADEDRLRDALKAGREVPGARLAPRGTHLRIR